MAVVKANAYGHGAPSIARALQSQVDALAVACIEEARELRGSGVTAPILLLEGVFEEEETAQGSTARSVADNRQRATAGLARESQHKGTGAVLAESRHGYESTWRRACTGRGIPSASHCNSANAVAEIVTYTHFATADDSSSELAHRQLARFDALPFERAAQRSQLRRTVGLAPGALRVGSPRLYALRQFAAAA